MHIAEASRQNEAPRPVPDAVPAADVQRSDEETGASVQNMIANHKGKLAVGAAAMLGLAVFYKWRESRLAKEDPEEYARLQRLKAAVGMTDTKRKP